MDDDSVVYDTKEKRSLIEVDWSAGVLKCLAFNINVTGPVFCNLVTSSLAYPSIMTASYFTSLYISTRTLRLPPVSHPLANNNNNSNNSRQQNCTGRIRFNELQYLKFLTIKFKLPDIITPLSVSPFSHMLSVTQRNRTLLTRWCNYKILCKLNYPCRNVDVRKLPFHSHSKINFGSIIILIINRMNHHKNNQ